MEAHKPHPLYHCGPQSLPYPSIAKKDFEEKKTRFKPSARTLNIWNLSLASSTWVDTLFPRLLEGANAIAGA